MDGVKDLSEVSLKDTLLITYKNPFNDEADPADICFVGKREIIQGIKLGVRLGLDMKFFSTDKEILDFAGEYFDHYTS